MTCARLPDNERTERMAELLRKERFSAFYARHSNKIILLTMYAVFVAVNTVFAFMQTYPGIDPNEISVAATGGFFGGKNWADILTGVSYYYDFLQGMLYTPVMLMFDNPVAQYRAMIILNGLAVSVIPLIIYDIGLRFKVGKKWKLICAACAGGGYCCYFAHSKFIWTEAVTIVLPWLLIWFVFITNEQTTLYSKHFFSIATAFIGAAAVAANVRLFTVVLAAFLTVLFVRVCYGKKLLYLKSFVPALLLFIMLERFVTFNVQAGLWQQDCYNLHNTIEYFALNCFDSFAENGAFSIVQAFIGQMYYLVTASWGVAALALCVVGAVIYSCVSKKRRSIPQSYPIEATTFAVFTLLSIVFTLIFGVFFKAGSAGFGASQDSVVYGRYLDAVIPFAVVLVMLFLYTTSLNLRKALGAVAILALTFLLFFVVDIPIIQSSASLAISPTLGLYALRIGTSSSEILTLDNLTLTASVSLCVIVLIIVVISCSKKTRSLLITLIIMLTSAYSLIFVSAVYLPMCADESRAKNQTIAEISEYVYNQHEAPDVTVVGCTRNTSMMLQFFNQDTTVTPVADMADIKENTFVLAPATMEIQLGNGHTVFTRIAETADFALYAYGEKAYAYALSQQTDDAAGR